MQKINSLLSRNSQLEALTAQVYAKQIVNQLWQSVISAELSKHTFAYHLEDGLLTVFVSNSAVASKIIFMQASLLKALENSQKSNSQYTKYKVTAIKVKVQVKSNPKPRVKRVIKLSSTGAQHLAEFSEKISGSKLGDILKQLASKQKN